MNVTTVPSPTASRIAAIIQREPGIHFRELERAAGLTSPGQLRHHLDRLQRTGQIVELEDGGFHRFFTAGEHDWQLRRRMARFSRPVPRKIATLLLQQRLHRSALRKELGCADSTLGYYLSRLEQQGDLVKHTQRARSYYALAHPEAVREVLEAQQSARQERDEEEVPLAYPVTATASQAAPAAPA